MGKPYSLDLRKRVVSAIEGGMSRNRAAKQFGVAISTAIGWMQRVEETGSVEPGQMGGHKPKAVSGDHAVWLSQRIRDGDFTIRGLVAELAVSGDVENCPPDDTRNCPLATRSEWGFYAATQFRCSAVQGSAEGGHAGAGRGFGDTPAQRAGVG